MTQAEKNLLKSIFWDTDINTLNPQEYKKYTIERILQYGRMEHVNWMFENFSNDDIIDAVKQSRIIDRRTANYWSFYYKINKNEILCFTKHSVPSNSIF
jgi:hypothetical protein